MGRVEEALDTVFVRFQDNSLCKIEETGLDELERINSLSDMLSMGLLTAGDAVLSVFDTDSNTLASDDDSGGGTDAALTFTAQTTARYVVGTGFLTPLAGDFQLSLVIS